MISMKTKFKLLACLLCLLVSTLAFSQEIRTTLSLLQGKQWKMRLKNNHVSLYIYKNEGKLLSQSGKILRERPNSYYLSDTIDTVFDARKIGKSESGKYLIELTPNDEAVAFEIVTLNDHYLVLKHVRYRVIEEFDAQ